MPEHQQIQQSKKTNNTFQKRATPVSQIPLSNPYFIIQRAKTNPKSLTHSDVMQLQRTIGNRAVGRLLSSIGNTSTAQQATVQRQEIPEEETCPSCIQKQEIPEEEEPLQGKMIETVQRQEIPEEEEPLQGKFEDKPEIACPSCFAVPIVQKQESEEEEKPFQGKMIGTIQRQEIPEEEPLQGKMAETVQRQEIPEEEPLQTKRENNTGMPDNLKVGVENLSGIDMSDVRVHYNSDKPAEVGALAYTQGTNIHVAPGQERHLPHEAWHVVQQMQDRVKPTFQMRGGISTNNDQGLEKEADSMDNLVTQVDHQHKINLDLKSKASFGLHENRFYLRQNIDTNNRKKINISQNPPAQLVGEGLVEFIKMCPWLALAAATTVIAITAWAFKTKSEKLDDLPEDLWWKLFIDISHHTEAKKLADPGKYYDQDQSKGHKQNMMNAFKSELLNKSGKLNTPVDLKEYERLHNLVTENLEDRKKVQKWSSGDFGTEEDPHPPVSFGIGGRGNPAFDVLTETLNGLGLMHVQTEKIGIDTVAITLFRDNRVYVNYSNGQAQTYVTSALTRYYEEVKADSGSEKLSAIAKVIRALHVIHPFRDANGRLHVMLMLNKFLKEQNFSPVILPNGPDVFGGSYSIPELVAEIKAGMVNFKHEVELSKDKDA